MNNLLRKSCVVRPIVAVMILAFMNLSFALADDEVVLKAGTMIPLEAVNEINSKFASVGQLIDFRVTRDIVVDKKVVIPYGSIAKGQITRFEKRKALGKGASMQIQLKSIITKDGTDILLNGGNMSEEGEDKMIIMGILSLFVCPLFLLMKGKEAVIPAGMSTTATVAVDTPIKL